MNIKIIKSKNKKEEGILINNRWQMDLDGVVYDTKEVKDIPQWIFDFRDFCIKIGKREITSAGGNALIKKYGKDYFKKLRAKRTKKKHLTKNKKKI